MPYTEGGGRRMQDYSVDPRAAIWLRDNVSRLEQLSWRLNAPIDEGWANVLGLPLDDLHWLRRELPKINTMIRGGALALENDSPAVTNVIRRILKKTAPEFGGCARWIGTLQGGKPGAGTPIISFQGKVVPARRLLWNLK